MPTKVFTTGGRRGHREDPQRKSKKMLYGFLCVPLCALWLSLDLYFAEAAPLVLNILS